MRPGRPGVRFKSHVRAGFNLVELLVIIGIVGLLLALLLPALSKAKATAKSAVCKSNLHQIGIALRMYLDDFQKYPSPPDSYSSLPFKNTETRQRGWTLGLEPYVANEMKIFLCPEKDTPAVWVVEVGTGNRSSVALQGRYGYNAFGTGVYHPELNLGLGWGSQNGTNYVVRETTEATVKTPSELFAIGDAKGPLGIVISPIKTSVYLPSRRHNEGSNLVFCDSHVEYEKYGTLVEETEKSRVRWNNDNQPHRETW